MLPDLRPNVVCSRGISHPSCVHVPAGLPLGLCIRGSCRESSEGSTQLYRADAVTLRGMADRERCLEAQTSLPSCATWPTRRLGGAGKRRRVHTEGGRASSRGMGGAGGGGEVSFVIRP